MVFYLTTLNLTQFYLPAWFFTEKPYKVPKGASDIQTITILADAWNYSEFLYRNYILNCLADSLYNMYYTKKMTKEPWESLY